MNGTIYELRSGSIFLAAPFARMAILSSGPIRGDLNKLFCQSGCLWVCSLNSAIILVVRLAADQATLKLLDVRHIKNYNKLRIIGTYSSCSNCIVYI